MSPDLHHLSGAYAVDALDDSERASFEQHLAVCADCRAEVAELSATAHTLASLSEADPPATLRASVLSGISRVRPLPPLAPEDAVAPPPGATSDAASDPASDDAPPLTIGSRTLTPLPSPGTSPEPTPTPRQPIEGGATEAPGDHGGSGGTVIPLRRRASTWFAAAAAAAVIAIGGVAWSPWSDDPATLSPVAQVAAAADAVRVSSTQGELTAEVAYSRQLGKAAITVQGLPPAPDGKTYQLWFVGSDDVARSAGLMSAGADGSGSMVLDGDPNSAAAVGMTLEPAGGSTQPTTDPLVVLALA